MKVTILGCGGSGGVPLIGDDWGQCDPKNPKNRRLRASILVEAEDTALLVDTSPDMRQQFLNHRIRHIDAVLYTHAHADHIHGIDELRPVNRLMERDIDIYADRATLDAIGQRFGYVLEPLAPEAKGFYYKPCLAPHEIDGPFSVNGIDIVPFTQGHGFMDTLGFRFGPAAYSTDVVELSDYAFKALQGVEVWIVDCLRERPHVTHAHLEKTLAWIERVAPKRAILTHMNHEVDYQTFKARLPAGVEPAYDGLVVEV